VAFTTHTTEEAGHDAFPASLIDAHLADYRHELHLSHESLMRLGRRHPDDNTEPFSMTVLAMRGASRRNSVSVMHATISRSLWSGIGVGMEDRPPTVAMCAITNGVHAPSWVGAEMAALYDRALGANWRLAARKPASWAALGEIPYIDLWRGRTAQRSRLMQHARIDGDPSRLLVLGFARRFATYKRADLLLQDVDRLARLLNGDPRYPAAIVFAGKAHPRDNAGKLLVQRVIETSRDARFGGRIVFLSEYDLRLAQLLVQGADVWLNTPRRGHEACGTSGMKSALNGALQLSELDGWWDEVYRPGLGWALGRDLDDDFPEDARDAAEALQLMDILERQVVPLFYARNSTDMPTCLLEAMVGSIIALAPFCSAERMLVDYVTQIYCASADGAAETSREF
jgi:starch phosphorylase